MQTVHISCTQKSYDVVIGQDLIHKAGTLLAETIPPCKMMLVTDDKVNALYGEPVFKSLSEAGFEVCRFVFKNGEQSKNISILTEMLEVMAQNTLTRSDCIVALGGGVTGDMAGFAASVYLRGIQFVQIPTTLLAAIDSSVGGKTGVNLNAGKNLMGVFWQPAGVLCDIDTLATLPEEVLADGMAEAIKYGMILDKGLFAMLQAGDFLKQAESCITRCVGIKGDVVAADEYDTGQRQLLNFGHTLGHAIEKASAFTVPHGHAVAMGMVIVTKAGEKLNLTKEPCLEKLKAVLKQYNLPVDCPYTADELTPAALSDKKRSGGSINLVVPESIGNCVLHPMPVTKLKNFIELGLEE